MSRNYTPPVTVVDGDTVFADDVNDLNTAADSAIALVEAEIDALTPALDAAVAKAQDWAEELEDVEVEPGSYSSLHHSAKSAANALLAEGYKDTTVDNVALTAADVVSTGLDVVATNADAASTAADALATSADVTATNADVVTTNADAVLTAADVVTTAANVVTSSDFAEHPEDTEVPGYPGEYSSYHWAKKSEAFSTGVTDVTVASPITVDKTNPQIPILGFSGTKADVGLSNVDNTSDLNKPVSTATQTALDLKSDTTHNHTGTYEPANANIQTHIGTTTGNPHSVTQAEVGLSNVDNTSDLSKPVSTATQTALDLKEDDLGNPSVDGDVLSSTIAGVRSWITPTGGLSWSTVSINTTMEADNGYLVDVSTSAKTMTLPLTPSIGDTVGVGDWKGTAETYNITIARNGSLIMGLAEDLVLDKENDNVTLVYANATQGWKIVSSNPVALGNPLIANKPLLHVAFRDTANFSAVIGNRDAVLDETLANEIAGASLSLDEVTLPAGKYWIEGLVTSNTAPTATASVDLQDSVGSILLSGKISSYTDAAVAGIIELTATTTVKLNVQQAAATATIEVSDVGRLAVINELKVWRLDQEIHTPVVASPPNTVVAGVPVTGNIMGLEYQMDSVSPTDTVTVSPGSTMDDTLTEEIILDAETDVTLVSPTINTIYHLFVTKDAGVSGVDYDTDENYPSFTGDYKRWIGFVLTDSAGDIVDFRIYGDTFFFIDPTKTVVATSLLPTVYTQYSLDSLVPVSRVKDTNLTPSNRVEAGSLSISEDGVTIFFGGSDKNLFPFENNWYLKTLSTTYDNLSLSLASLKLKR